MQVRVSVFVWVWHLFDCNMDYVDSFDSIETCRWLTNNGSVGKKWNKYFYYFFLVCTDDISAAALVAGCRFLHFWGDQKSQGNSNQTFVLIKSHGHESLHLEIRCICTIGICPTQPLWGGLSSGWSHKSYSQNEFLKGVATTSKGWAHQHFERSISQERNIWCKL